MSAEAGPERASCAWIPQVCLCVNLRMASRVVTQLYDDVFAPTGLRSTHSPILLALALGGSSPLTRLAEMLAMDRTTLTRNLLAVGSQGLGQGDGGGRPQDAGRGLDGSRSGCSGRRAALLERGHERVTEALGDTFSSQLVGELKQTVDRLRENRVIFFRQIRVYALTRYGARPAVGRPDGRTAVATWPRQATM